MFESIDPSVLSEFFANLDLSKSSALASFFSFFQGIQSWRATQRKDQKSDDLDAYIDWVRRQEHQQVVDIIEHNREAFSELFRQMESSVVAAIETLNRDQERRHQEVISPQINVSQIKIKERTPFRADIHQQTPQWQTCEIHGFFDIVNQSQSSVTIKNAHMSLSHGESVVKAKLKMIQSNTNIEKSGGNGILNFVSLGPVRWKQGEVYEPIEMTLEVIQLDNPITFRFVDGKFQPQ